MPSCKEYASPQKSPVKPDDTSMARSGSVGYPIQSFFIAMTTAQQAYFELMSQCTLGWINAASAAQPTAPLRHDDGKQSEAVTRDGSVQSGQHALVKSADWLSVPVITGIEETLNDQLIKPRRPKPQENDVLTLWKRSNEFGTSVNRPPPATHREVA